MPVASSGPGSAPSTVSDLAHSAAARDLARARASLVEAELADGPQTRYLGAQLAALRAAAVVLALRTRPGRTRRSGPRNAWRLLAEVAPELGEWAAFFDLAQTRSAAVRAGDGVRRREADDLVDEAQQFLSLVERLLLTALRSPAAPAGPTRPQVMGG